MKKPISLYLQHSYNTNYEIERATVIWGVREDGADCGYKTVARNSLRDGLSRILTVVTLCKSSIRMESTERRTRLYECM